MAHYLTRAPVAIETFDDVGRSYKPYERFYRAPTHAAYSNGYRMSPYHKRGYGCGCGFGNPETTNNTGTLLALSVAGLVIGYLVLKQF